MASENNVFSAVDSLNGYLYQCRYALLVGLKASANNPGLEISIEKFDDIALESEGEPIELIQTKCRINSRGDLTNASVDLWKTLRIWAQIVAQEPQAPFKTRFILLTTAAAPESSATFYLRQTDRNINKALELLEKTIISSKNEQNEKGYKAFAALSPQSKLNLLDSVVIADGSSSLLALEDEIGHEVRRATSQEKLPAFCRLLEGWWLRRVIDILGSGKPGTIPISAIEDEIDELREAFKRDSLPVEFQDRHPPEELIGVLDQRPFVNQLKIINIGNKRIEFAIRDYYRATEQRSLWAREDLLVDGEMESFERKLVEAWEPRFEEVCDDLQDCQDSAQRVAGGQSIYRWVATKAEFPLRNLNERFLTHGSYHILANRRKIGWHPDYLQHVKGEQGEDE